MAAKKKRRRRTRAEMEAGIDLKAEAQRLRALDGRPKRRNALGRRNDLGRELAAMQTVVTALEPLQDHAKQRVMTWLNAHFE